MPSLLNCMMGNVSRKTLINYFNKDGYRCVGVLMGNIDKPERFKMIAEAIINTTMYKDDPWKLYKSIVVSNYMVATRRIACNMIKDLFDLNIHEYMVRLENDPQFSHSEDTWAYSAGTGWSILELLTHLYPIDV